MSFRASHAITDVPDSVQSATTVFSDGYCELPYVGAL